MVPLNRRILGVNRMNHAVRGPWLVGSHVFGVAQICNLLYRRIAFCGRLASASALELSDALPITNRRYGRLQICATTPRCAPWLLPSRKARATPSPVAISSGRLQLIRSPILAVAPVAPG